MKRRNAASCAWHDGDETRDGGRPEGQRRNRIACLRHTGGRLKPRQHWMEAFCGTSPSLCLEMLAFVLSGPRKRFAEACPTICPADTTLRTNG